MVKKNPKIGKSQIAGGVKVQLPKDSPLIGVLKTDQYDIVNLYTNEVDKSYVPSLPDTGEAGLVEIVLDETSPGEIGIAAPNLEDITLIGKTGKRYSSGQTITDPDIYYDTNNNRFLKVKFEIKNSVGDIVTGVVIV
jgi:hypothetical protein